MEPSPPKKKYPPRRFKQARTGGCQDAPPRLRRPSTPSQRRRSTSSSSSGPSTPRSSSPDPPTSTPPTTPPSSSSPLSSTPSSSIALPTEDSDTAFSSLEHSFHINPSFVVSDSSSPSEDGFYALKKYPRGSLIFAEKPLFVITEADNKTMDEEARAKLQKLGDSELERVQRLPNNFAASAQSNAVAGLCRTNCLPCGPTTASLAFFAKLQCLNHACRPNAELHWNGDTGMAELRAIKPVQRGEEVTISYACDPLASSGERARELKCRFGFICRCSLCAHALGVDENMDEFDKSPRVQARDERRQFVKGLLEEVDRTSDDPHTNPAILLRMLYWAIQQLKEEFSADLGLIGTKVFRLAFDVAVAHGSLDRAKEFGRRALESAVACTGFDSGVANELRLLVADPKSLASWGQSSNFPPYLFPTEASYRHIAPFDLWLWSL